MANHPKDGFHELERWSKYWNVILPNEAWEELVLIFSIKRKKDMEKREQYQKQKYKVKAGHPFLNEGLVVQEDIGTAGTIQIVYVGDTPVICVAKNHIENAHIYFEKYNPNAMAKIAEAKRLNAFLQDKREQNLIEMKDISDGYHTFQELYDHRIALFLALCRSFADRRTVWRAKLHSDGTMFDGCFIVGINEGTGEQITYHLPIEIWDETDFIREYDVAPCVYDGHTPQDVLERLKKL